LNTPKEKRDARTTDIISIAHPYVIRYSIADCATKENFVATISLLSDSYILMLIFKDFS